MADITIARDLFQLLEAVVTCSVCKQPYNNPRVLTSCFHTFCLDCIRHSQVDSNDKDSKDFLPIKCPGCLQVPVLHPEQSMDMLKKNYLVEKLLEVAAHIRSIDCG
jgi:RING-type zinc-finger